MYGKDERAKGTPETLGKAGQGNSEAARAKTTAIKQI
jgi:hypothetical protein